MFVARRVVVVIFCLLGCLVALPALAGFRGTDVFLPMVGRNAGIHPSNWYTKVWVYNPNATAVDVTIYLLERSTSNPAPPFYTDTIQAGDTMLYENAVFTLFGVEVYGAMRVVSTDKVVVSSRVYSQATGDDEEDSVGQFFAGVPASFAIGLGETSEILGVHQTVPSGTSEFRYNFGFVETTGNNATVRVTAYDETGVQEGQKDFQVREYSQRQVAFKDHFPTVSTENSRLEVEVVSGTGKIIAYGSGIANGSQDPSTFEMTYYEQPVVTDATLTGDGTVASPLGLADAAVTLEKLGTTNPPALPSGLGAKALAATPVTVLTSNGVDLSWSTAGTGDVTGVTAGDGLTGGGVEDDVTLAVGAGAGIDVQADTVGITTGGVATGMLADDAVTTGKIAPNTVTSEKIQDGEVATADLGDSAVTSSKLQDGAVTTAKLAGNAVTTANIADNSVSSGKIIDGSVGPQDLADQVVTKSKLAAGEGMPGQVLAWNGSTLMWANDGVALPLAGSATVDSGAVVAATNLGSGIGVTGVSTGGVGGCGLYGQRGAGYGTPTVGAGVAGVSATAIGVYGWSTGFQAVAGESSTGVGVYGNSSGGVGVWGVSHGSAGVYGWSPSLDGVFGETTSGTGAFGRSTSGTGAGGMSNSGRGVWGQSESSYGVHGKSTSGDGVFGEAFADSKSGVFAVNDNAAGYAGYFRGRLANNRLAGSGNRAVYSDGVGVLTNSSSDVRLKRNVVSLTDEIDVLAAVSELRGVAFNWNTSMERAAELGDQREIGMIAQEVEAVLPYVVGENFDGYKSLDYARLTAFLIEVAKAQQAQITQQESQLSEQESRIQALEVALAEMDSQ